MRYEGINISYKIFHLEDQGRSKAFENRSSEESTESFESEESDESDESEESEESIESELIESDDHPAPDSQKHIETSPGFDKEESNVSDVVSMAAGIPYGALSSPVQATLERAKKTEDTVGVRNTELPYSTSSVWGAQRSTLAELPSQHHVSVGPVNAFPFYISGLHQALYFS